MGLSRGPNKLVKNTSKIKNIELNQILTNVKNYSNAIEETDSLGNNSTDPLILGLYGEVGSVMAIAKKRYREQKVYSKNLAQTEEELGDTLWYLITLCRRLKIDLIEIFTHPLAHHIKQRKYYGPSMEISINSIETENLFSALFDLGKSAAALLEKHKSTLETKNLLIKFIHSFLCVVKITNCNFETIMEKNSEKALGRFTMPRHSELPIFDQGFCEDERLPEYFEITIAQKKSGKCYLKWHGVFIGDPLTDNNAENDGYRFHDVFHLAFAAILHWSPTFRSLIKHKRKSKPEVDEQEDGGRAIVIEEGLTAWIFSVAKQQNYFENQDKLSFDLLKTIQEFIKGYEVENCPLNLWERAILDGYKVFNQIRKNNGGIVIGDRVERTITYKHLDGINQ